MLTIFKTNHFFLEGTENISAPAGIILAYFLLDEMPSANILIGGFLILTTVGLESFKCIGKIIKPK